ncbi:MAG TPA: NADH-quinone oxidoreductase subunit C [Nitrososphaerales archaeon]|nr:NADH-quinone oxidoreductase subunit C [Nitrososphaerales archaeon]
MVEQDMAEENKEEHPNAAKYEAAIRDRFGKSVERIFALNGNELHIVLVSKEAIPDLCYYLFQELRARLVTVICNDERRICGAFTLRYVFAKEGEEDLFIVPTANIGESNTDKAAGLESALTFPSIALRIPPAALYEREIKDMFGLLPAGNPDTRPLILHEHWPGGYYPLRKDFSLDTKVGRVDEKYQFTKVDSEGVFEIPVGPVHAGIIEPGHFRFSVLGENIINLETRLFYTHKGTEKLAESLKLDQVLLLSERISGDESVANSIAYCQAIEKIAGVKTPEKALQTRTICAELERVYNHLGTLAGMATDVGYSYGAVRLNILKERMMQLNESVSGSRLLFGVNRIGGVGVELNDAVSRLITKTTTLVLQDFKSVISALRSTGSVIDRFMGTGTITREVATDMCLVGIAARCAGVDVDTRRDHPYAAYRSLRPSVHYDTPIHRTEYQVEMQKRRGDALSRFDLRVDEVRDSVRIINQVIDNLRSDDEPLTADIDGLLRPYDHALGYAESHRGQTVHWVMIGEDCDSLFRYKVRTASFVNWPAIEQAVLNDIVPDFPLVNKSLDLSYSGNDL